MVIKIYGGIYGGKAVKRLVGGYGLLTDVIYGLRTPNIDFQVCYVPSFTGYDGLSDRNRPRRNVVGCKTTVTYESLTGYDRLKHRNRPLRQISS